MRTKIDLCDLDLNVILEGLSSSPLSTIFWQDLTRNLMGQFKIWQWVLNVLFLFQIYVCVVIRETSFCLFLTIIKLMLLQHWTLNQDYPYFKQMVSQIYPIKPQLNKANTFDTEALFSNLDLSITNGIVFELVDFSFLDECFKLPFLWCKHFATYSFFECLF